MQQSISSTPSTARQARRGGAARQARNPTGGAIVAGLSYPRASAQERKMISTTKPSSQASSSRPVTPAPLGVSQQTTSPTDTKIAQKRERAQVQPPPSPLPSPMVCDSEGVLGSQAQDAIPPEAEVSLRSTSTASSGFPTAPPGLAAPPGITPSRPPRVQTTSPQTPLLSSQSSYQMSTAARALLDDVKARRESAFSTATGVSPFPDFDRTLQTLSREDGGGFSFNLDPAFASEDIDVPLQDFEGDTNTPFHGSYVDAFPALRPFGPPHTSFIAPPGLPFPHPSNHSIYDPLAVRPQPISGIQKQTLGSSSSYMGSFDPFAEASEVSQVVSSVPQHSLMDDDPSRKVSRFGFARGRQAAASIPSPLPVSSPLSYHPNSDSQSFGNSTDGISGMLTQTPWSIRGYEFQPSSTIELPLMQHTQSEPTYTQQQTLSQAFDSGVSEAQLRNLIQFSREKVSSSTMQQECLTGTPYVYYCLCLVEMIPVSRTSLVSSPDGSSSV